MSAGVGAITSISIIVDLETTAYARPSRLQDRRRTTEHLKQSCAGQYYGRLAERRLLAEENVRAWHDFPLQ